MGPEPMAPTHLPGSPRRPARLPAALPLVAAGLFLFLAAVPDAVVRAAASGERLEFIARQTEVDLTGSFARYQADIAFDPAHPEQGHARIQIDLASADAGGADADALVRGNEFFDVAHFPQASFESTAITARGDGSFVARGPLTLKGHRGEVLIPFTLRREGERSWFEGQATISRLAYDVGRGQWADTSTLDDEVRIRFRLPAAR